MRTVASSSARVAGSLPMSARHCYGDPDRRRDHGAASSSIMGSTRLGRSCILAPNVFVSSGTHPFRSFPELPIRRQEALVTQDPALAALLDRPVWIQDDCWLGANVVVCPGVVIGRGSVIGANAVVLQDVPPYSVVAGVPAQVVGKRLDWIPPVLVAASAGKRPCLYALRPGTSGGQWNERGLFRRPWRSTVTSGAHADRVRVEYQARTRLRVRAGQTFHDLQPGSHTFRESSTRRSWRRAETIWWWPIEALSEDTPAQLRITSVARVEGLCNAR